MKLRESVQRYSVGKHGSEYLIYPSLVMICPECQSMNVREVNAEDDSCSGDYLCTDCGCEFDTWIGSDLTKAGTIVSKMLTALCVIFVVLAILCLIGGLVYAIYLDSIYPDGSCPENLEFKVTLIATLGPAICIVMAVIAANINEKI